MPNSADVKTRAENAKDGKASLKPDISEGANIEDGKYVYELKYGYSKERKICFVSSKRYVFFYILAMVKHS